MGLKKYLDQTLPSIPTTAEGMLAALFLISSMQQLRGRYALFQPTALYLEKSQTKANAHFYITQLFLSARLHMHFIHI